MRISQLTLEMLHTSMTEYSRMHVLRPEWFVTPRNIQMLNNHLAQTIDIIYYIAMTISKSMPSAQAKQDIWKVL